MSSSPVASVELQGDVYLPLVETYSEVDGIDQKVCDLVLTAIREAEKSKGKDIIALIGNAGVGKSTAINNLVGREIRWNPMRKVMEVVGPEIAAIGHELGRSKTLYTKVYSGYPIRGTSFVFADCAGFLDPRKGEGCGNIPYEIPAALSLKYTLENAKSVKIAICIDARLILSDNSVHFSEALEKILKELLKDYKSVPKATMLMLTKPPVFEDERFQTPYTRETAIRKMTWLRDSLEEGDSRIELLNHVLQNDGEYIAIYDPIVKKTKDQVLQIFEKMEAIERPKEFFAIPYSAEVRLSLIKTMSGIAIKGVTYYQGLFERLDQIENLDEEIQLLEEKNARISLMIEPHGGGKPDLERIRKQIATFREDKLGEYQGKQEKIQIEIESLKQEVQALDDKGNQQVKYWEDEIKERGIKVECIEIVTNNKGESEQRKVYVEKPITRDFHYQGLKVANIDFSPPISAKNKDKQPYWSKLSPSKPVDQDSFSIRYQTGKEEDANAVIKVFVNRKDLPETIDEKLELVKAIEACKDCLGQLSNEIATCKNNIEDAKKLLAISENDIDKLEFFKNFSKEINCDLDCLVKDKLKLTSENEEIKKNLSKFGKEFYFVKNYIQLSQDQELAGQSIIQKFLDLDHHFHKLNPQVTNRANS